MLHVLRRRVRPGVDVLTGLLVFGLLILAVPAAAAQDTTGALADPASADPASAERVTLEEALRLFRENNLSLRIAQAGVAEARGRRRQVAAYPNPGVSVTYEPLFRGGEQLSETYVTLSQEIAWPGERSARIEAAGARTEAAQARAAATGVQGALRVVEAFVETASAEARVGALRLVTEEFQRAAERGLSRFREGDFAGYSLRRVRVEHMRYQNDLLRARLDRQTARRELALLIFPEGDVRQVRPVMDFAARPTRLTLPGMIETALQTRPALEAARAEVEAARWALRAARRAQVPDPTLTAGYKRQSNGFQGLYLGVSVPIPLFDRNQGAAQARQARLRAAQTQLLLAERRVKNEVRDAFARYAAFRDRLGEVQEDLPEAPDALLGRADHLLEVAQVSYREGGMSLVELLDAAEAYRDARLLTADLLADYWKSYFALRRAAGLLPNAITQQTSP